MGRKIRVDISQKKTSGQNSGKPKKSSRELRAMREEAEDSKSQSVDQDTRRIENLKP